MKNITLLALIILAGNMSGADFKLEGWKEIPIIGSVDDPTSKSFYKITEVNGFVIRNHVTYTYSPKHKTENVIDEIEIKKSTEGDLSLTKIARTVTIGNGDKGFWLFLNSFNDKYQVYGGIASNDGSHFAKPGEKFITVIPKDTGEGKPYWVLMFISDAQGVYHVYDKADAEKYNSTIKK